MKALPFRSLKMKLLLFSVMHLVTDGLCAYLVFSKLYTDDYLQTAILFFAYNILAFVTQAPVGILIDKYNKPKIFLAVLWFWGTYYLTFGICRLFLLV